MEPIVEKVRAFMIARWKLGPTHGVSHWDRVYRNGQRLLTPDVDPLVVGLFAYLHDSCRQSDGYDHEHGPRAAEWIETLRGTLLRELTDQQMELLRTACRQHTISHRTGNPTVDACFDADRLDLGRVGITPDPAKMATQKGSELAAR